ncbi:MAG: hypothetical protein A2X97_14100 [Bdellovibrionales bacterium GWA1_52_35]|nr:MAG: hypothetical protein A2X97_14100 [Bdellovibrionales bacterium GWA1_52_35]
MLSAEILGEAMSLKCELCGDTFLVQRHHKYSQTKWARKLYGALIDDPRNITMVCGHCHTGHASPNLEHWNELQFTAALEIEPRSKLWRARK